MISSRVKKTRTIQSLAKIGSIFTQITYHSENYLEEKPLTRYPNEEARKIFGLEQILKRVRGQEHKADLRVQLLR